MNDFTYLFNTGWFKTCLVIFFILLFLAVLYLIYYSLRGKLIQKLVYTREFSEEGAYESEYVTMTETIWNKSFLPLFFIDVESYIYNGLRLDSAEYDPKKAMQYFQSRFHLLPFMRIKRKHTVKCLKRGYYVLETVDIFYHKTVRYLSAHAELYVYPKVIPLGEIIKPSSMQQGESITTRRIIYDPFTLNGIRDYMSGDPFNSINFKATARSGALGISGIRVNKRDYCSSRTIMVYLNFQTDIDNPIPTSSYEPMIDRGLSYASALIRDAAYSGYRAGFAANCVLMTGETEIRFPVEHGDLHLKAILKEMAKVRPSVGVSFMSLLDADIKRGMSDTEIYVITPYISDDVAKQMYDFRNQGNYIHVIKLEGTEKV